MSLLLELKAKLDAVGTLGTIKTDYMPEDDEILGVIYQYGGQAPERRFGISGVGYEKPACQIVFRGAPYDSEGPKAKAMIAMQTLMAIEPGALGAGVTTIYLKIDPQQTPFPVTPIDAKYRHKFGFNFYIMKEP